MNEPGSLWCGEVGTGLLMALSAVLLACEPVQTPTGYMDAAGAADAPVVYDAAPIIPDAAPVGGECDMIAQTECHQSQKCAWIYEIGNGSGVGAPGCWPQGGVPIGDPCDFPDQPGTADDCVGGAHCAFGVCKEICRRSFPSVTCLSGAYCTDVGLTFDVCMSYCDPLEQDCPEGEGCYLMADGPICITVVGGAPPGSTCSTMNKCEAGSGCLEESDGERRCSKYCDYLAYPEVNDPDHCHSSHICGNIIESELYGACGQ